MFDFFLRHEKIITRWLLWTALVTFLLALASIATDNLIPNLIPDRFVPASIFGAITPAISVLLVYELFVLTLGTRGSFVSFIHREFEVISLIVLRDVFKQMDALASDASSTILTQLIIIAVGSLVLYFLVEVLERVSRQIVKDKLEKEAETKKKSLRWLTHIVETLLLAYFLLVVAYEGIGWLLGIPNLSFSTQFLELIFIGLVIYNIISLFRVLLVSNTYETLFEHSALVIASSVVFITLSEPPIIAVPMVIGALAFVVVTLFLHGFARGERLSWSYKKIKRQQHK